MFEGVSKYYKDQAHLFVNDKVPPVAQKARRSPYKIREKVLNEFRMLKQQDIIDDVKDEPTLWISPIVVVPKNHDKSKTRLCIDMWEANKEIERKSYPSPSLEGLINILQGSKIYCKLDMNNAFLQFELDSSLREITTFTTHEGLYRFKRLNFGTNAASEILQSKLDEILGNLLNCMAITDDAILLAISFVTMYDTLDKILNRFFECGITLNKGKCKLFINKVEFFWFVFSENDITSQTKIASLQNMPPPTNISELRSFLVMTNYLSRFIPNYSMRIYSLLELTKKI